MTNPTDPVTPHFIYNMESGHAEGFMTGLTKREYFAAMAMQGIMANPNSAKQADGSNHTYNTLAIVAINAADALIVALNTTPNETY